MTRPQRPGTPTLTPSAAARHIHVNVPDLLRALYAPVAPGLDDRFRSPLDPPGDSYPAYERATMHYVNLDSTHVASIWERALNIGFSAGRYLAMEDAKKEGEVVGLEKGKAEGLSEGKRLGFIAGREFGEKQASKNPTPQRVLVDTGTDLRAPELSPSPPPPLSTVHASAQTDAPCTDIPPSLGLTPPLNWADESRDIYAPERTGYPPPPHPRDLSALRSDSTSLTPFDTLRYRAHRTQKSPRTSHRSTTRTKFPGQRPATHGSVPRPSSISFAPKPFTTNTPSFLDWDRDPRLVDLSRALRSLGWER
ncbi:hypothetical protein DFH09DRAFT_1121003 [Mycena vulgaris]|nr:hypothetical protein DFH09DRAFT_1121003 [Mycena vulgaris]